MAQPIQLVALAKSSGIPVGEIESSGHSERRKLADKGANPEGHLSTLRFPEVPKRGVL